MFELQERQAKVSFRRTFPIFDLKLMNSTLPRCEGPPYGEAFLELLIECFELTKCNVIQCHVGDASCNAFFAWIGDNGQSVTHDIRFPIGTN